MTADDPTAGDIAALLGGGDVRDLARMLGGASRETWSFTYDGRPLVLRRDPPGSLRAGGLPREAALMTVAAAAGVPVPEVIAVGADYLVMTRLSGETLARRILRDDEYAGARDLLVEQCAAALARLHAAPIDVRQVGLPVDRDPLSDLRDLLDEIGDPHPVLELGLLRLEHSRPPERAAVLVHGDFRLGNLMVDPSGLVGVLDWELAHIGNPVEDLGWLCVRSWRFGARQPVAGVGSRDELLASYADATGNHVSAEELAWWELYGTVRWGVICGQQAAAHLTGAVRSIELAAIGRRTAEVELDVLELLEPDLVTASLAEIPPPLLGKQPNDRPTAGELLDAVDEWVAALPLDGHAAFEARVVRRVLAIVAREVELGPMLVTAHEQRLDQLDVADDAVLAREIRAGRDGNDIARALVATAVDKLRVADPRQLER